MMSWLSELFAGIFIAISTKLVDMWRNYQQKQAERAAQKARDAELLKKYTDAVKSGATDEELAKDAEDLLNGKE